MSKDVFNYEDRLVIFAADVIAFTRNVPNDIAGNHLSGQLIRAANGAALNYGEARGSQTDKDFVYKTSLVLKELNEVNVSFKILARIDHGEHKQVQNLRFECM